MKFGNILMNASIPLLLAACAAPGPEGLSNVAAAPPSCAQVATARAAAAEARQDALDEQAAAWKVVVPVVAAARLAQSAADLASADDRIAALDRRAARMGCAGREG